MNFKRTYESNEFIMQFIWYYKLTRHIIKEENLKQIF